MNNQTVRGWRWAYLMADKRILVKGAVLLFLTAVALYLMIPANNKLQVASYLLATVGAGNIPDLDDEVRNEYLCLNGSKSQRLARIKLPLGPVPDDAIHFVLSNGTGRIKPREMCSFESAALRHPDKAVIVNVMSPLLDWTRKLKVLKASYPNIRFIQLDLRERFNGTPFGGGWLDKGLLDKKPHWKQNYISDIFRLVTIFKYGGVYLDADMLVLKPFTEIRNAIPLETDKYLANGNFMAFDKGHPFLWDVMKYLAASFQTIGYADNGPPAVTRVMVGNHWCIKRWWKLHSCSAGINLLPAEMFNPVDYKVAKQLLMANKSLESTEIRNAIQNAYAVHLYHSLTQRICIHLNDSSLQPVSSLVKKSCPILVSSIEGRIF